MKRIFCFSLIGIILLVGCASNEDAYDVEGFTAVKKYVDTIIPQVDELIAKKENNGKINATVQSIKETNNSLYIFGDGTSYDESEMSEWEIGLGLEEGEWEVSGQQLYHAMENMKETTDELVHRYEADHELNEKELQEVIHARETLGKLLRK